MAFRKLHSVVAVLGVAVAGGAAWWWQNRPAGVAGVAIAANTADARATTAGASGVRPGGGGVPGPVAVEVGKAESVTLRDDTQAVGSLRSRQGVMLRPEVSGRIAQLPFTDGQRVRRGQLMVQLDDTLQQAQLQQAQAQASIARTNLQRSRELLAQSFVSQSAVDQNVSALQVADAQVALAQAQLARMKVLAPFDGTTGIRVVNIGDYVKDGADLVNVEDLSAMFVDFRLPERHIAQVHAGLAIEVALDALPGVNFKGRIEAIDSQVDANGRALLVRARVDNANAQLKPGMFARPRVVFSTRAGAIVVPEEALVPQGERQFIYLVVDDGKGQKLARRVEARVGQRLSGKVEVLGGVSAGAMVVTAGQSRLRGESMPVRVIELGQGTARGLP